MATATCEQCGVEVQRARTGRPRTTCSDRCRQARSRQRRRGITAAHPAFTEKRWVRRDGKRPVTCSGAPASSTNPATWATYDEVLASTAGNGYGVMLGDGLGCIDLDDAFDADGHPHSWATDALDSHAGVTVYVERSMSGRGLHAFILAAPERGTKTNLAGGGRIETYSRARFIAVTEDQYPRR